MFNPKKLKMGQNSKNKKSAFQKNMEIMTRKRIESMEVLDSYDRFRLLRDHTTGNYVAFNNFTLDSHYSRWYNDASSRFDKWIGMLD